MTDSIMRDKSKELAKRIIILCRNMKKDNVEFVLINQLLRYIDRCKHTGSAVCAGLEGLYFKAGNCAQRMQRNRLLG